MNCNQIKILDLENCVLNVDEVINEICSFKLLVSLQLPQCVITKDQMRKLTAHLPHLTKFSCMAVNFVEPNFENKILSALSIFPKLTNLKIMLEDDDFYLFLSDFMKSIYEFHARLAKTNTEIRIANYCDSVSMSKDRIILYLENSLEMHWMDNFNEKIVRKVMNREWNSMSELKFINNCAETTVDISTLINADTDFEEIECLDFQSIGPISVHANVCEMVFWYAFDFTELINAFPF